MPLRARAEALENRDLVLLAIMSPVPNLVSGTWLVHLINICGTTCDMALAGHDHCPQEILAGRENRQTSKAHKQVKANRLLRRLLEKRSLVIL